MKKKKIVKKFMKQFQVEKNIPLSQKWIYEVLPELEFKLESLKGIRGKVEERKDLVEQIRNTDPAMLTMEQVLKFWKEVNRFDDEISDQLNYENAISIMREWLRPDIELNPKRRKKVIFIMHKIDHCFYELKSYSKNKKLFIDNSLKWLEKEIYTKMDNLTDAEKRGLRAVLQGLKADNYAENGAVQNFNREVNEIEIEYKKQILLLDNKEQKQITDK